MNAFRRVKMKPLPGLRNKKHQYFFINQINNRLMNQVTLITLNFKRTSIANN